MNRRQFIKSMMAAAAGSQMGTLRASASDALGDVLPVRPLGDTGESVTMLGVGGFHVGWTGERDAEEVIETALQQGIRFFDTAYAYGGGRSEERYGRRLVPKYRDAIFLMTKSSARDYASARAELETSLRRLRTDTVDLWQLHSLGSPEDVDARIEGGVLDAVEEALADGRIRYAGFTGHRDPAAHSRMLERTAGRGLFAAMQMPVNVLDASAESSFLDTAMQPARDRGIGVLAMKTLADGRFFAEKRQHGSTRWATDTPAIPRALSMEKALQFAWSLPVSVLITGAENASLLTEKVRFARRFAPLDEPARDELLNEVAAVQIDPGTEYYKAPAHP